MKGVISLTIKISAKVKDLDNGEWINFSHIRWISLDKQGIPERICGPTGLQYEEFELFISEEG